MLYQIALSCGPTSITALIATLASIVPLITSAVIYREPLSAVNTVGVVLIVITLVINADIKKDLGAKKARPTGRKWFFFIMLAFCGNSLGMLSQQMYAKTTGASSSSTFVACSSVTASLFALAVFGILRSRGHEMSYRITPRKVLPCVAVGVILGVFQIIHTYAMAVIPGTVLFPTYSAGSTITIALCSRLLFREKLSRAQSISLVIGIAAIVLINI
jgi:multidrug transporter EmrE-like cation transporter